MGVNRSFLSTKVTIFNFPINQVIDFSEIVPDERH